MTNLYKVSLRFSAVAWTDIAFAGQIGRAVARQANGDAAIMKIEGVHDWLNEAGRREHYVNVYDNTDDDIGQGEIIVVLNDRSSAIMLKLALA